MAINKYTKQYVIFENGVVKSLVNNNLLKPRKNPNGYMIVTLGKEQLSVHRLVAIHFIANPYSLTQVNHRDGNKENNHVNNIEWCTAEQNMQHALESGLRSGFISYDAKFEMLLRVLDGVIIADIAKELPDTHPNTLTRMLRVIATKEGRSDEWKTEMKRRRKNAAIRNLAKINS